MSPRGTSNTNERGGSPQRRARKRWLLETFGDGATAACALRWDDRCQRTVTYETLQVDRIIPGILGGDYRRGNIRPACGPCNSRHGTAVRVVIGWLKANGRRVTPRTVDRELRRLVRT